MALSRSMATVALAAATRFGTGAASVAPAALRGAHVRASNDTATAGDAQYDHYSDKNAFAPYGATDIDTDATAPSGLTAQQCEERCTADSNCMCVSQERSTGKCWKRSNCDPSKWTSEYNAGFDVYMKRGSAPPAPGPSPEWGKLVLYTNQNKCLDVKDHKTTNGNMVQLWDCFDSDSDQYWNSGSMDAAINGDLKWANHPEKCLDVKDHKTSNGTPLQIWDCIDGDFDQHFFLDQTALPSGADTIPRPVGRLRWKDHPSKCVVVKDGGDWNGNSIVLEDCVDKKDSQYWVNNYVER